MTNLPRCGAKTRTGGTCNNPPMTGATRCRMHGGASPRSKAAAAARIAEAKARAQMARLGLPDPVKISHREAMIWSVSAKYAEVCWLREMVQSIAPNDLVWGVTRERTGGDAGPVEELVEDGTEPTEVAKPVPERTYEARANIWWVMLRGAEDQLVTYAKAAHAAGIDDERVDLAKQQGQMLGAFLDGLMAAMFAALVGAGVTRDEFPVVWAATIADLFPRHFRALGGAA